MAFFSDPKKADLTDPSFLVPDFWSREAFWSRNTYGLFEELRERFNFLMNEDRDLYGLITSLPFETSVDDLNTNLKEL